ncbi:hypothetical protein LWI29_002837 [Acer saccharum]|uniref:Uncharacterized protein n=1 Tax=Acer saccharum TaxID=4024 RepID=A0AA39SBD8_ACESA|nr:hypothetical protein LWI29_002837 [Acer saccharum]
MGPRRNLKLNLLRFLKPTLLPNWLTKERDQSCNLKLGSNQDRFNNEDGLNPLIHKDMDVLKGEDASCLTLYPLHDCMWDAILGCALVHQRGRPAPLTGANRPVARRWSCAGVDQRGHQRRSPSMAPLDWRWWQRLTSSAQAKIGLCAGPGPPAPQNFSGEFSKRPHFTYGLYIYANLILGHYKSSYSCFILRIFFKRRKIHKELIFNYSNTIS